MRYFWIAHTVLCLVIFGPLAISRAQQPVDKTYTLVLSSQEVNIIASALVERPYKDVASILEKLRLQVVEQNKPTEPPKKD